VREAVLHPSVRIVILTVATVVFAGAAILLGLPSQPDLPKGLGRIIVMPDLPEPRADAQYVAAMNWVVVNGQPMIASLTWSSLWVRDGAAEGADEAKLYAVTEDDATATLLAACAASVIPSQRDTLSEIDELPEGQRTALEALHREERGSEPAPDSYRYFVLGGGTSGRGSAACPVDAGWIITRDDLELHIDVPQITVLTPVEVETAERSSPAEGESPTARVSASILMPPVPTGWTIDDVRVLTGERWDSELGMAWDAMRRPAESNRVPTGYAVSETGPITLEATSVNNARAADRNLFWSGLLVGLAGSTLLMLFDAIPWGSPLSAQPRDPVRDPIP
jgi:hypothetical protein